MNQSFDVGQFLNGIGSAITSPMGLTIVAATVVFSLIASLAGRFTNAGSGSTGYIQATVLGYLIPILILFTVANVFFFPVIPDASASGLPDPLSFILTIIFNFFLMLTIIDYATARG